MQTSGGLAVTGTDSGARVTGNASAAGGLSVGQTGGATPRLMACRASAAGSCIGGDLDATASSGVPDWSEMVVFGDPVLDTLSSTCTPPRSTASCLYSLRGVIGSIPTVNEQRPEIWNYGNFYETGGS